MIFNKHSLQAWRVILSVIVLSLLIILLTNIWIKISLYMELGRDFKETIAFTPEYIDHESLPTNAWGHTYSYAYEGFTLNIDQSYSSSHADRVFTNTNVKIALYNRETFATKDFVALLRRVGRIESNPIPAGRDIKLFGNPRTNLSLKHKVKAKCRSIGVDAETGFVFETDSSVVLVYKLHSSGEYGVRMANRSNYRLIGFNIRPSNASVAEEFLLAEICTIVNHIIPESL